VALESSGPRIRDLLASIVALDNTEPDCPGECATYCMRTRRLAFMGGALACLLDDEPGYTLDETILKLKTEAMDVDDV
jgi:hypothetical protein